MTPSPSAGKTNAYPIPSYAQGQVFDSVQVAPSNKVIALTFDDGPAPGSTEQVLAVLAQNNVKATFFQVGKFLAASPDLGRKVRDAGHAIGNHTWEHLDAPSDPADQVNRADTTIQSVYGGPTGLFRPPYGNFDNGVVPVALANKDAVIIWSVDPKDWDMPGTDVIVNTVVNGASPGGIVLLHDGGGDRSQTIAALPRIISTLRSQGYRFVTVPELLAIGTGEVKPPRKLPRWGDSKPPVLTVTTPGAGYSYSSVNATGTVTDARTGVLSVDASIKRMTDNLYWSGTAWTSVPKPLSAQINVNNWTLPMAFLADGRYNLAVSSTDKSQNISPTILREFWIDNVAPTTKINAPLPGAKISGSVSASGTVVDVGPGVASVSTALIRLSDGFWWNGTTWTSTYSEVKATLTGSTWTFAMPTMSAGNYTFYAQGLDYVGNVGAWVSSSFTYSATAQAQAKSTAPSAKKF